MHVEPIYIEPTPLCFGVELNVDEWDVKNSLPVPTPYSDQIPQNHQWGKQE
jgi:hypothetical protein